MTYKTHFEHYILNNLKEVADVFIVKTEVYS